MTLLRNRGTGQTIGSSVTIANSDDFGETQFKYVSAPAPTYDNAHVLPGQTVSFKISPTSGASNFAQYGAGTASLNAMSVAVDFWIYRTAVPGAEFTLVNGTTAAGGRRLNINMDANGFLRGRAENAAYLWTFANATPLNAWVNVKLYSRVQGVGASLFKMAMYDSAGALIEEQSTLVADRVDPLGALSFGKAGTDTSAVAFWLADIQVDTAATGYIGEAAPSINVVSTQLVSIDASTSTGFAGPLTISQADGETGTAISNGTNKWLVPVPSTGSSTWRLGGTRVGGGLSTYDVHVSAGAISARGPKHSTGALPSTTWV